MSWLRALNRLYRSSRHRCSERGVYLEESPECEVNFGSMAQDALILLFEKMLDERDDLAGDERRIKCDLVALQGDESHIMIVLVEVKAGASPRQRTVRSNFGHARRQLSESAMIACDEIAGCRLKLPKQRIGHAVVVVSGAQQESVARNVLSNVNANFRRQTGFRLSIARCGQDIGQLVNAATA